MSYRISYGPKTPIKYQLPRPVNKKFVMLTAIAAILILAVIAFPTQAQALKHKLLPWTTPESKAAISTMLTDIEQGVSYEDAITAFCAEIIRNATDAG